MPEPAETMEKLSSLEKKDYIMIVNLINQLSQKAKGNDDLALFREIRKQTSKNPMTEEEVEAEVAAVRRERHANSN